MTSPSAPRFGREALADLARDLTDRPGAGAPVEEGVRPAAVLALLRVGAGDELEILLIRRAEYEGDPWSGHVALPGGRQEPADRSLEETAIRETREEIGIDVSLVGRVLGTLDDISPRSIKRPRVVVRPFVAELFQHAELAPSAEVAAALWVPLRALAAPEATGEVEVVAGGVSMRRRSVVHLDYVIWGITERILRDLLARLGVECPPE